MHDSGTRAYLVAAHAHSQEFKCSPSPSTADAYYQQRNPLVKNKNRNSTLSEWNCTPRGVQCTGEKKAILHMKTPVKSPGIHLLEQTAMKYSHLLRLSLVRFSEVELDDRLQHSAICGMERGTLQIMLASFSLWYVVKFSTK